MDGDEGMSPWFIGGVDARIRLVRAVENEMRMHHGATMPTDRQIAMVLHALADHTSLMEAVVFSRPKDGYWPEATSIGRFLHAYGDYMTGLRRDEI